MAEHRHDDTDQEDMVERWNADFDARSREGVVERRRFEAAERKLAVHDLGCAESQVAPTYLALLDELNRLIETGSGLDTISTMDPE